MLYGLLLPIFDSLLPRHPRFGAGIHAFLFLAHFPTRTRWFFGFRRLPALLPVLRLHPREHPHPVIDTRKHVHLGRPCQRATSGPPECAAGREASY